MASVPDTHYARHGDVHLAYQVARGAGPDLLPMPTATFPIDLLWDEPVAAVNLRRLASVSRLITCDLLGAGSSPRCCSPRAIPPACGRSSRGAGRALDAALAGGLETTWLAAVRGLPDAWPVFAGGRDEESARRGVA